MSCGCQDSANGVSGFSGVGCNQVGYPSFKWSNVRCDKEVQYTHLCKSSCPKTCRVSKCQDPVSAFPNGLPSESSPAPGPSPSNQGPVPTPAPKPPAPTPAPKPPAPPPPPPACQCPSDFYYCDANDKHCYQTPTSNSYTGVCRGRCTSSAPAPTPAPPPPPPPPPPPTPAPAKGCVCPASYPSCYKPYKWCYKSPTSNSYTSTCGGKCTADAPAPPPPPPPPPPTPAPPPPQCVCPGKYPHCSSNTWCYKSKSSYSYTQTCAGKCTASAKTCTDHVPSGISAGGKSYPCSKLGRYCEAYKIVENRCCATCAAETARRGNSGGTCNDKHPTTISYSSGGKLVCSEAAPYCKISKSVRTQCCATCKKAMGGVAD